MARQGLALASAFGLAACVTAPASNAIAVSSYNPDCRAIGSFLDNAVAEGRTVGASTLIWKDGREVCFANAGSASREAIRTFARDTLVQVFSMTKPVTGVALMQLWEQGKFGLDDLLYWHRDLKVATEIGSDGNLVLRDPSRPPTVRDVLRHTAGFTYGRSDEPADRVWAQLQPLSTQNTLAEFSARMAKVPLRADPGTRWIYSASVDIQARLVETLSGMAFDEYVATRIFAPLEMNDSGWHGYTSPGRTALSTLCPATNASRRISPASR
ncbi:serine hydrolase [Erythrobacter sp. QSSC1-22B]|uniref:serine hydrolase domain-containing protein n=1 Tax=Erythrobacter sp. QSSC1-22B TaxID=1860125 RepID=UPI000A8E2BA2|nr:serine hydrolase domain-containing protein [Erythrobacter sp. QSSC1-22B]